MTNHLSGGAPDKQTWRCFHCDEVFTTVDDATNHFGPAIYSDPACAIDAHRLRELEAELARYRQEDTDLHRELHCKDSERAQAVIRAEEVGYRRGLIDGHRFPNDAAIAAGVSGEPMCAEREVESTNTDSSPGRASRSTTPSHQGAAPAQAEPVAALVEFQGRDGVRSTFATLLPWAPANGHVITERPLFLHPATSMKADTQPDDSKLSSIAAIRSEANGGKE